MQLQLQNFATLVANAAATVQGSARQLVDVTVGSTLRAILEANASLALWLQWLILQVLRTTRAATSQGVDLDTWMADFGIARSAAVPAYGAVTFSRFTPSIAALVPVGTSVRTSDRTQSFVVVEDTAHPAWSVSQNGYILAANVSSVTAPVLAVSNGLRGNVQEATITLIAAAIPGVDTVTNEFACQGGLDPESDTALRIRFGTFLASRSRATTTAIGNAISAVQQGLHYRIEENTTPDGAARPGTFTVILDDGSGHPSSGLVAAVSSAIDAVRPVGSAFAVLGPIVTGADVSLTIATSGDHATALARVVADIETYTSSLDIGAPLLLSRIVAIAIGANPSIINVTHVLINGVASDLAPSSLALIRPSRVVVT